MAARFRALPLVALLLGALDTLWVRWEFQHRPPDLGLFVQSAGLWLVFGLLAVLPAALCAHLAWRFRRGDDDSLAPRPALLPTAVGLAVWAALPVVLHTRLDGYTAIGGDTSALKSAGPWLDVLGSGAALIVVGWLAARFLARVPQRRVPALAGVLAGLSILTGALVSFHESPATNARGEPAPGAPNVLLMIWDTTRAKSLQFLDYDRETTPHLAALTDEALVFEEARSVASYTLTSHLSMLTGSFPSHHGARMTRQRYDPRTTETITQLLRDRGYRTGGFVGTGVLRSQTGVSRGFEVYDDRVDPPVCDTRAWALVHDVQSVLAARVPLLRFNGLPHWIQDFQRPADEVLARAGDWIRTVEAEGDGPWFGFVNMYDVHWPYLPDPQASERWVRPYDGPIDGYLKRSDRFDAARGILPEDDRHLSDLYDAEMWRLDRNVESFLAGLDLGSTAVIVTSDHGEAFGEGGRYEHADILECQVRVPLLVRPAGGIGAPGDGSPGPRRIDTRASGVDVAPTVLALAGLEPPDSVDGENLLALETGVERTMLVEDRDHFDRTDVRVAYYERSWKLLRLGIGNQVRYQLFHLPDDPDSVTDVAAARPEVVQELSARLDEFRARWGADDEAELRAAGDGGADLDALRALGYLAGEDDREP